MWSNGNRSMSSLEMKGEEIKTEARKSVALSDLLACPFCGNDVDVEADEENEFPYFIECKRCYIRTDNYVIKNHLIERWNRRAS